MSRWTTIAAGILVAALIPLGCSGRNETPIAPAADQGTTEDLKAQTGLPKSEARQHVWGYYDVTFDIAKKSVEVVPNRSVMFALNVVTFLNANPAGIQFVFNGVEMGTGYVDVDVDITITHPLDIEKFDGYDVRGLFIGEGSGALDYNADLIYPVQGVDQEVLNADGYSRWFNAVEFGNPGIFGYTEGKYAAKEYEGTATLCPYKYFGEGLGATDDLWDYLTSGDPHVGYFLHGTGNTRNYQIRFPLPAPGIKYGYAVVANWAGGDPGDHPAHAPEAVGCSVVDQSGVYYWDATTNGGDLVLDITVFDWDSELSAGVMEDYAIKVESTVLSSHYHLNVAEMTPIASGDNWYTYHVEIPADNVTGIEGNEFWIAVEERDEDYTNPFGVPNDADTDAVAACFRYPLYVYHVEPPWIEVSVPNGGEAWLVGSSHNIEWDHGGWIEMVDIVLSLDSGENYTYEVSMYELNDGTFEWDPIPVEAVGETCRIRIQDNVNSSVYDDSDADFSIVQPSIRVTAPNGGEQWLSGTDQEITWDSQYITTLVNIWYSTDDFVSDIQSIAGQEENDGSYLWQDIPPVDSDTVKVRVSTDGGPLYQDESDDYFTIYTPVIEVVRPNGGEEFIPGGDELIMWTAEYLTGTVFIEYSKDDFVSDINTVATDEDDDGTCVWEGVPLDPSDTVKIRISSTDDPTVFDISDANFRILQPTLTLTCPNGGEQWDPGTSHEITWVSENLVGTVDLSYSKDDFVSDINVISSGEADDGSFIWDSIPLDPSTTVKVGISSTLFPYPLVYDSTDGVFEITQPTVTVTAPNGGEDWDPGAAKYISWETSNVAGNVLIEYSKDGFVSDVHEIASDEMNDWLYMWDPIPLDPSTTVTVRISSMLFPSVYDVSDADFTIAQPDITVTVPNGGEVWQVPGPDHEILWTSDNLVGNVDIDWSTDNFVSDVNPISGDETNDGVYVWNLPCEFSDTARVRVSSVTFPSIQDASDGEFTLGPAGWAKQYGTDNGDYCTDCVTGADGNSYVCGYTGPTMGQNPLLVKYSPCGALLWQRLWSNSNYQIAWRMDIDDYNNVYIAGYFQGTSIDFDPTDGTDLHSSNYHDDCFLTSLDEEGNYRYTLTWGSASGADRCHSVGTDGSNYLYSTGFFFGTMDADPGSGTANITSNGASDCFVIQYDLDGNFQWAEHWGGSTTDSKGYDICADPFGHVYHVGQWQGTDVDFDPGTGTDERTSAGGSDAFLIAYDTDGNYYWGSDWGSTSTDYAYDMCLDEFAALYLTGVFSLTVDFDPGTGGDSHASVGGLDVFLAKYASDGSYGWTVTWGGSSDDYGRGVDILNSSDLYVSGQFQSSCDFDPDPDGTSFLSSSGDYDAFISKLDSTGDFFWARRWGSALGDACYGSAVDATGCMFAAGYFCGGGVEFAQTGAPCNDTSTVFNSTGVDGFFVKYLPNGCW